MDLENLVEKAEQYFSEVVESGSDQQLFIAGYLQGHFFLVLAQCQQSQNDSTIAFKALLLESLEKAFAKKELEPQDQRQVVDLLEALFSLR